MKAVVYHSQGDPLVLTTIDLPKPSISNEQVLIKVGASGINPVDTYFRSGIRPVTAFPAVPHFDVSGTIVEVGSEVSKWNVGDKVWATNVKGTAVEYIAANEDVVFPLANHLTEVEGAAIAMPFMTAHLALFYRAHLRSNETVLIYGGAGAVGHAAIQLAKQAGAFTIATTSDEEKAVLAKEAGADEVILYQEEDVVAKVTELTKKNGVDVILDVSLSENIKNDLTMIKMGGRIVTVGSPKNTEPTLPWRMLNFKNATLLGILLFTVPKEEQMKAANEISKLFFERKLTAHVGKIFSFNEAAAAHEAVEKHLYNGSIVITPK